MGDRLRKARSLTGMNVRQFAEHIGVSHGTVTNAETDARAVRVITLRAWAMATGVSLEWLERGIGSSEPLPPGPHGRQPDADLSRLTEKKMNRTRATKNRSPTPRYVAAA